MFVSRYTIDSGSACLTQVLIVTDVLSNFFVSDTVHDNLERVEPNSFETLPATVDVFLALLFPSTKLNGIHITGHFHNYLRLTKPVASLRVPHLPGAR